MAIYYYEDQNGKYSSHTDARRFSRVSGKEAYAYLKSAEGKTRRFMKSNDYEDGGDDVFVEIPAEYIRDYRQGNAGSSMSTTSARMPDLRRFLSMPCRATEIRTICFRVKN